MAKTIKLGQGCTRNIKELSPEKRQTSAECRVRRPTKGAEDGRAIKKKINIIIYIKNKISLTKSCACHCQLDVRFRGDSAL